MLDGRRHNLRIGESVRIKRGFMTRISLGYAGVPSDGTTRNIVAVFKRPRR